MRQGMLRIVLYAVLAGSLAFTAGCGLLWNSDRALTQAAKQYAKGNYDRALLEVDEVIRREPDNVNAYRLRVLIDEAREDWENVVADAGQVLRLDPKDADAYVSRGNARLSLRQFDKALADFRGAVKADPYTHNDLAWLLATAPEEKLRNGKEALAAAMKACELSEWQDGVIIDTLAAAYAETGDFAEAVKWQKKAMEFSDLMEDDEEGAKARLALYLEGKPYREEENPGSAAPPSTQAEIQVRA